MVKRADMRITADTFPPHTVWYHYVKNATAGLSAWTVEIQTCLK